MGVHRWCISSVVDCDSTEVVVVVVGGGEQMDRVEKPFDDEKKE
jgi:hypothetical protein